MLPIAVAATLLAALVSGQTMFSGSRVPHAGDNPDVDRVCHAIKTLSSMDQSFANRLLRHAHPAGPDSASPPPWPPLPHEVLNVDIMSPPSHRSLPTTTGMPGKPR
jgi:hypothetical protein